MEARSLILLSASVPDGVSAPCSNVPRRPACTMINGPFQDLGAHGYSVRPKIPPFYMLNNRQGCPRLAFLRTFLLKKNSLPSFRGIWRPYLCSTRDLQNIQGIPSSRFSTAPDATTFCHNTNTEMLILDQ